MHYKQKILLLQLFSKDWKFVDEFMYPPVIVDMSQSNIDNSQRLWLHCVRIEVMKIKWGVLWQFFDQTTVSRPLCSISYSMWTPRGVPSIFYHHTHLIWLLTKEAKLHSFWKKNMRWENETPCGLTFWQKTQQVCRVVGI